MAVEKTEKKEVVRSEAYKTLEKVIEAYKIKNPIKYEMKKEALSQRLASL